MFVGTIPDSGWKSEAAKIPGSKMVLRILNTKEGLDKLSWDSPVNAAARLEPHKAKAPADLRGKITIAKGTTLVVLVNSSSISTTDLRTHLALSPGYYAVRIADGANFTSDWMTFRVK